MIRKNLGLKNKINNRFQSKDKFNLTYPLDLQEILRNIYNEICIILDKSIEDIHIYDVSIFDKRKKKMIERKELNHSFDIELFKDSEFKCSLFVHINGIEPLYRCKGAEYVTKLKMLTNGSKTYNPKKFFIENEREISIDFNLNIEDIDTTINYPLFSTANIEYSLSEYSLLLTDIRNICERIKKLKKEDFDNILSFYRTPLVTLMRKGNRGSLLFESDNSPILCTCIYQKHIEKYFRPIGFKNFIPHGVRNENYCNILELASTDYRNKRPEMFNGLYEQVANY